MRRTALVVLVVCMVFALAGCAGQRAGPPSTGTSSTVTTTPAESQPATPPGLVAELPAFPPPGDWDAEITNPWFPFKPGTTFRYQGLKDGATTVDRDVVTNRKKNIAGVMATVVRDTMSSSGRVIESTEDWYAQDNQGNVWYLGESTKAYDAKGKVSSTQGSWQTGVDGAEPGLFMPAAPIVGDNFYQEYYKGRAEDAYTIISLDGTVTVPFGTFQNLLVTEEKTVLEPGVVSRKYYVQGTGLVYDVDVKGSNEYLKLVSVRR